MRRTLVMIGVVIAQLVRTANAGPCEDRLQSLEARLDAEAKSLKVAEDALAELRTQKSADDKRAAAVANLEKTFGDMIAAGQVKLVVRRGMLTLVLPSDVLFDPGGAVLSRSGEKDVAELSVILKAFNDRRYLVVAHTDNEALAGSDDKDHWDLSVARSLAVARLMMRSGLPPKQLVTAGAADSDPVADNSTAAGRQRNRRVEIILLPAETELPPLPAGSPSSK